MISSWYLICIILIQLCLHTSSETIERCSSERKFNVRNVGKVFLSGFIHADLDTESINNVIIIKNTSFQGILQYPNLAALDLNVQFDSLKTARVQRTANYEHDPYPTTITKKCSIGFTYNFETRLVLPIDVMNNILNIARECIEKKLCDFDPQKKVIGGNVAVMARMASNASDEVYIYTKQDTFNLIVKENLKKIIDKVTEKSTAISVPPFTLDSSISISASGAIVNVLKHIDTQGDITFLNEGQRFVIGGTLYLTGGNITIHNLNISISSVGYLYGNISVNTSGISLSLQETLDLSGENCNLNVEIVNPHIPVDAFNFTGVKTIITNTIILTVKNVYEGAKTFTASKFSEASNLGWSTICKLTLWRDCSSTTTSTTTTAPPMQSEIEVDFNTFLHYIPYNLNITLSEKLTKEIKALIFNKLQNYTKCTDFIVF